MKTEKFFDNKEDLGLVLRYCGVEYCEPNFVMYPHRREEYLLHYVFGGSGIFRSRDKEFSLSVGSIFAIFPRDVTSYAANPNNPLNFCWIGFSGRNSTRIMEMIGFSVNDPVLTLAPDNELLNLVTRCVQLCESDFPNTDLEIQSILYKIFSVIECRQGCCRIDAKSANQVIRKHILRAKSYIQLNYMKPLTVQKIARRINLDRTYLSKIFHQLEGNTIHDYLTGYRIESAKRLLLETRYGIQEVGVQVGIPDVYYFSRIFKRYTGLAPSQYRLDRQMETEACPVVSIIKELSAAKTSP
jgi:AraC-like DNA-binding protein